MQQRPARVGAVELADGDEDARVPIGVAALRLVFVVEHGDAGLRRRLDVATEERAGGDRHVADDEHVLADEARALGVGQAHRRERRQVHLLNRAALEERVKDDDVLDQQRAHDEHRPERGERELSAVRALDDEERADEGEHPERMEQVAPQDERREQREEDERVGEAARVEPAVQKERARAQHDRERERVEEPVLVEHRDRAVRRTRWSRTRRARRARRAADHERVERDAENEAAREIEDAERLRVVDGEELEHDADEAVEAGRLIAHVEEAAQKIVAQELRVEELDVEVDGHGAEADAERAIDEARHEKAATTATKPSWRRSSGRRSSLRRRASRRRDGYARANLLSSPRCARGWSEPSRGSSGPVSPRRRRGRCGSSGCRRTGLFDAHYLEWDARAHTLSAWRYHGTGLFPNDLLVDFAAVYYPPGVKLVYWIGTLFANPHWVSKFVPFALGAVVVWQAYALGRALGGRVFGAAAVVLLLHCHFVWGRIVGLDARAFGFPLMISFLRYTVEKRERAALAILFAETLFYPSTFLICAPAYGATLLWPWKLDRRWLRWLRGRRRRARRAGADRAARRSAHRPSDPAVGAGDAAAARHRRHLAAAAGGRHHAPGGAHQPARRLRRHPLAAGEAGVARERHGRCRSSPARWRCCCSVAGARSRKVPIVLPAMFLGSLVAFSAAQWFPYRLYIPERMLQYAWPPVLIFGFLLLAYLAFSTLTRALGRRARGAARVRARALLLRRRLHPRHQRAQLEARATTPTVQFIATLPKDAMIAASFDTVVVDPDVRAPPGAVQLDPEHADSLSDRARARAAHRGILRRLLRARSRRPCAR